MRTKYSIINSVFGIIYKMIQILCMFGVRIFFTKYLLVDYLGLEGLFANIVGLFSLADLGLGSAISFSLYKPLYENNTDMIDAIMKLFRKVFIIIGVFMIVLSICVAPLVPYVVESTVLNKNTIVETFIIYTIGTAITYFFSYNRTLLFAMQRNYIVLFVDNIKNIVMAILQVAVLIYTRNYYLYLVIVIIFNFLSNFIVTLIVKKEGLYNKKTNYQLPSDFKSNLIKQTKALAISDICGKLITSTDNIIISFFLGLTPLAINTNYALIIQSLTTIVNNFITGSSASIANLIVEGNNNKIHSIFYKICFISAILASFCAIGFYNISYSFIKVWLGNKFLFSNLNTLILSINLYIIISIQPILIFQNMAGMYVYYQKIVVIGMLLNIICSIVLVNLIGITGVFLGTFIAYSYEIVNFVKLLYDKLFLSNYVDYWKKQIRYFGIFVFCFILTRIICKCFTFNNEFTMLFSSTITFLFIFGFIYYIFYRKDENFTWIISLLKRN